MASWDNVTHADVVRAIREYDRLGPDECYAAAATMRARRSPESNAAWPTTVTARDDPGGTIPCSTTGGGTAKDSGSAPG
jgi:hypothetical protein